MKVATTKISQSQGENKRHKDPVVALRFATGEEGLGGRDTLGTHEFQYVDAGVADETAKSGSSAVATTNQQRFRLLRGVGRSRRAQEIVTIIAGQFSSAINKTSATSATITLTPSSFQDWTAYIGLYDEVTLLGGDVWFTYDSTLMGSTAAITGFLAWDPVDGATAVTGNDILCYRDHYGPFNIPTGASWSATTGTSYPPPRGTASGFYHFKMRPTPLGKSGLDKRPEASVSLLTPVNLWMSVNTSNLNFGYLKPYFANPSAVNNGTLGITVRVKVGFRLRNG